MHRRIRTEGLLACPDRRRLKKREEIQDRGERIGGQGTEEQRVTAEEKAGFVEG